MGKHYVFKITVIFIIILSLFVIICLHAPSCIITRDSLVISFIGTVAGIVVIGNIAQVYELKREHDKQKKLHDEEMQTLKSRQDKIDKLVDMFLNEYGKMGNKKMD